MQPTYPTSCFFHIKLNMELKGDKTPFESLKYNTLYTKLKEIKHIRILKNTTLRKRIMMCTY